MTYRVLADVDICQGHQMCQGEAPDVFGFDADTDQVVVLDERPGDDVKDDVKTAVAYCPAFALTMEED